MAKKRIFTVGFELPGDEFEYVPFDSDQSLLDADVVLYEVGFGEHIAHESYQGESLFGPSRSVEVNMNLQHWRSELTTATNAGKLVIIYLAKPLSCFRYTGDQQHSGTGRSRTTINIVTRVKSYSAVPTVTSTEAKSGQEIRITKDAGYLSAYWKEFSNYSPYEVFIEGKFTNVLLTTRTGNKTVGAEVRGNRGVLLLLPPLRYENKKFVKYNSKSKDSFWTSEALKFGKRMVAALIGLSDVLLSGRLLTPPPEWALDQSFSTAEESGLHGQIAEVSKRIAKLQNQHSSLQERLDAAGSIRALLYEQGKPLERAVREALTVMGFSAQAYAGGDSEFDVVFHAPEGRCLGEVEGKDSRAINVDKISQLERNLQEDFAREEIQEFAKGVLFGNAGRLTEPSKRGEAFTEKCISAAKRAQIALVCTPDLFDPMRYLRSNPDEAYAKECREAIFRAEGEIVQFPLPPISQTSEVREEMGGVEASGDVNPE